MERPIFKPIGSLAEDLDTPALVVDLDALEANIEAAHGRLRGAGVHLRVNVERHRCPAIAHKQLAAAGARGVCVSGVSEAELFAQHGVADILVASPVVTAPKIRRLCALANRAAVGVVVDSADNARRLSDAAQSAGVALNAAALIGGGEDSGGVQAGQPAVDLAKAIRGLDGLRFAGLARMDAGDLSLSDDESRRRIQETADTAAALASAGIDAQSVSVGGSRCIELADGISGVTEVVAGSYALMDGRHSDALPNLRHAARVLATVTSLPEPGVAILDTGRKAMGDDSGFPAISGASGGADADTLQVASMSAEHGKLQWDAAAAPLRIGGKIWLTPADIGACANVYDYIHAVRGGRLEAAFDVSARGLYR